MQELTDSTEVRPDPAALRARLAVDGYLYFRRFLPVADVGRVRRLIADVLADCCWLAPGSNPDDLVAADRAVGEGADGFHGMYTAVQMRQEVHELAIHPLLLDLAEDVLAETAFGHPMHIFRMSPPSTRAVSTPIHQDYRLIQGCADTLTTWIPLADLPGPVGGLRVLAGSHRLGVLPVHRVSGPGGMAAEVAADDPRWRSTAFTTGDVLLFPSLTVHGAVANHSDRIRLSADFRYQPVSAPVALRPEGFVPHYYPDVPHWRTLARGWTSTRSIEVPDRLVEVDRFDYHAAQVPTPPSRFVQARR